MFKYIIDDREHGISKKLEKFSGLTPICRRMSAGDFALSYSSAQQEFIVALFERKTLADFAASLRDGRYENKEKMIEFRATYGSSLFFIVERGTGAVALDAKFAGISLATIESSTFHMQVRDGINIIWTTNADDTIEMLNRFCESMVRMFDKSGIPVVLKLIDRIEGAGEVDKSHPLRAPVVVEDCTILADLWACFSRITKLSAHIYYGVLTIADLYARDLATVVLANGKRISPAVLKGLCAISKETEIELLAKIPRCSKATAKEMLNGRTLRELLAMPEDELASLRFGEKVGDVVGKARARNFMRFCVGGDKKE